MCVLVEGVRREDGKEREKTHQILLVWKTN